METRERPCRTRLFGALAYQPRWGLTGRGWLMLLGTIALLGGTFVLTVHPFLALTKRLKTNILVVEGWLSPGSISSATREFYAGGYDRIYVTGVPWDGPKAEYENYADQGYRRLEMQGVAASNMVAVVAGKVEKDRTYTSARALRQYFREHSLSVTSLTVFTSAAHARRSHMLFQKAFGDEVQIGVIACPPSEYRPDRWWTTSSGVREIISETAAYLYARVFFWPGDS